MISLSRTCLLLLLLLAISTGNSFAQPKARGKATFRFYPHAQIEIVYDDKQQPYEYRIVRGKNTVFEYTFIMADDSMIADDEFRETIVFEIGRGKRSFVLNGAEIMQSKCFYYWACFCADAGNHLIKSGHLSGKKFGRKRWLINLDITYEQPENPGWKREAHFDQQYFYKSKLSSR